MTRDRLLNLLIDAVARGDSEGFDAACRANARTIAEEFNAWRSVPPEIAGDPEKFERYAQTLIRVAHHFDQSGYPALLEFLASPRGDEPPAAWESRLFGARQLLSTIARN